MQAVGPNSVAGIVSGLETNAIVNAIVNAERGNARVLEARQAESTNMISAYRAIEAKFLAIQSQLGSLARPSTFTRGTFTISDDTVLSATANGEVAVGNFDIQVLKVARNHQLASIGIDDPDAAVLGTGDFKISVGAGSQQTITINSNNNSLTGLKDAINSAEAGVTASIINDGSSKNSYRLILTAQKTGAKNTIGIVSTLTGGINPDFSGSSFDVPETDGFSALATSTVSLGSTASYTGAENKTFTFTVAGTGTQTVGTDIITLNWTDGTNSGSIVVNSTDTEVALTGTGSDGLSVSFGAGDLIAGDTFTVSTFASTLQNPSDARISLGSTADGGAPIQIVSESNEFTGVIPGMNVTIKKVTDPGTSVSIIAKRDIQSIKGDVNSFISAYNDAMVFINGQFSFNPDTLRAGVLISESQLRTMQSSVRNTTLGVVKDLASKVNSLATIGIRADAQGRLRIADTELFEDAINSGNGDIFRLFGNDIISSRPEIELLSATNDTRAGTNYDIDITQAATRGYYEGVAIVDPSVTPLIIGSANNTLKVNIGPTISEDITLTAGTYSSFAQLVDEIQRKIDADENIGSKNVQVSFTTDGSTGKIRITSGEYGSNSFVDITLGSTDILETSLGFKSATKVNGLDVAGTINGEETKGSGQILSGIDGNDTTEGLKLKITLTSADLAEGAEGQITLTKGVASRLKDTLFRITDSINGSLSSRVKALDEQAKDLKEQIDRIDQRLILRRERLFQQFQAMEQVLGQLNAQGAFLANGLASLQLQQ